VATTPHTGSSAPDWLRPPEEQGGGRRFLELARERPWLIALPAVLALLGALLYVSAAEKVYEAQADLLITPVPADEGVAFALGLIPESNDPALPIETAAQVVTTTAVAERAGEAFLGERPDEETLRELQERTRAEPVGQSNIVALIAEGETAEDASELANAFAEAAVEERTDRLHERIDAILPGLEERIATLAPESLAGQALAEELAQLESLRAGEDPTVQLETPATPPTSPKSPRPVLTVVAATIVGLMLGALALYAIGVLDPRLRREAQLRRIFDLPILARVPVEPRHGADSPLGPTQLTAPAVEAYRTLRAALAGRASAGDAGRVILVTGASPSEGKTTTAVNLAASIATSGRSVILIESDLRRPAVGKAFGVDAAHGVVGVLIEKVGIEEALVTAPSQVGRLRLLLSDYGGPGIAAELFSLPAAGRMIEDARRLADYVIIDSPPLTEVIDALPLARRADDVVVVVRIGRSNLGKVKQLGDLLATNGIKPAGFAVVGTPRPTRKQGYYYANPQASAGGRDGGRRTALPAGAARR